jgi:hypothetical protein
VPASNAVYKLATSRANAINSIAIDITSAGGASQTIGYTAIGASPEAAQEAYLIHARRFANSNQFRQMKISGTATNASARSKHVEFQNDPGIAAYAGSDDWNRFVQYSSGGQLREDRYYPSYATGSVLRFWKNAAAGALASTTFLDLDTNGLLNVKSVKAAHLSAACTDTTPANTITANGCSMVSLLAGATQIKTINTCDAGNKGRTLTVLCGAGTPSFGDAPASGGNLFIGAAFTCTGNDSISFLCDGANWIETSRSVN